MFIAALMDLLLQNRAVKLGLVRKVPKNNGFVDIGLRGKISSGRAPKAIPREQFYRRLQNFLPLCVLASHVSKYLLTRDADRSQADSYDLSFAEIGG